MRVFALMSLFLRVSVVFGQNFTDTRNRQKEDRTLSKNTKNAELNDLAEALNDLKLTEFGSFLDEMIGWTSSANEYFTEKSEGETLVQTTQNGRKLKYKKAELKFIMKALIILKVLLAVVLPLGIIASKILSWKAVTLSLMAFMLAKILFVKNLLTGKNAFLQTPTNFVPPLYIHGGPHEVFWKRQGDAPNANPWT